MRISTIIQIAGLTIFTAGIFWFSLPLGVAMFGGLLCVMGILIEKDGK